MQEERVMHEAKLAKMEAEMKMVFQQKVQEKEAKLKQSEEELYARHREMKEALEKQRLDLDDKKRKLENGRPLTPENKNMTSVCYFYTIDALDFVLTSTSRLGGRRVSFVRNRTWQSLVVSLLDYLLFALFLVFPFAQAIPYRSGGGFRHSFRRPFHSLYRVFGHLFTLV
jgi:hypothetical protein